MREVTSRREASYPPHQSETNLAIKTMEPRSPARRSPRFHVAAAVAAMAVEERPDPALARAGVLEGARQNDCSGRIFEIWGARGGGEVKRCMVGLRGGYQKVNAREIRYLVGCSVSVFDRVGPIQAL